jgi:hypothetical protein
VDYVEWSNISTGVYMAKSAAVMSVEECPLCKTAFLTDPDSFGEVQCLRRHVFAAEDDGENYTMAHLDSSSPQQISTHWAKVEDAYVANLNSDLLGCPKCQSPLDLSEVAVKNSRGSFYASCASGHEFDAYVRVPHIWLYDTDDGPFHPPEG